MIIKYKYYSPFNANPFGGFKVFGLRGFTSDSKRKPELIIYDNSLDSSQQDYKRLIDLFNSYQKNIFLELELLHQENFSRKKELMVLQSTIRNFNLLVPDGQESLFEIFFARFTVLNLFYILGIINFSFNLLPYIKLFGLYIIYYTIN